jgi:hypothetical protein
MAARIPRRDRVHAERCLAQPHRSSRSMAPRGETRSLAGCSELDKCNRCRSISPRYPIPQQAWRRYAALVGYGGKQLKSGIPHRNLGHFGSRARLPYGAISGCAENSI